MLAAVAGSGVAGPHWTFEGFLPRSGRDRRERLERIAADERGAVVFEAPGRMAATLRDLAQACGADRPGAVCRELTKLHEEIVRGPLGELAASATDGRIAARGEFVVVIGEWPAGHRSARTADAGGSALDAAANAEADRLTAARAEVERLVTDGMGRSDAARRVSGATGIPRRQLYGRGGRS